MRMRRKRNLDARLQGCGDRIIYMDRDVKNFQDKSEKSLLDYAALFGNDNPVVLEIGCGKGQFAIEYAKTHPESELHKCFEWSDTEAARKYRLMQARQITINLKYVPLDKSKQEVRVFHLDTKTHVYEPVTKFVVNSDKYARLLAQAKAELVSFERKYHTISELESVFEAINEL